MTISIVRPDGVSSSKNTIYSTTSDSIFLTGTVTDETGLSVVYAGVTYSVSINADKRFIFPDPEEEPEGFNIVLGSNVFLFRGVGGSSSASVSVSVIYASETGYTTPNAPLEMKIDRKSNYVDISFTHTDNTVTYYNIYASTESGGGLDGYQKINYFPVDPLTNSVTREMETVLSEYEIEAVAESADPLLVSVKLSQETTSSALSETQSDLTEIPETVGRLRVKGEVRSVEIKNTVVFKHDRIANSSSNPPTVRVSAFASLPSSQPLYYVAKSVRVINDVEIESAYSTEIAGKPIEILASVNSLPVIGKRALTQSMISDIYTVQPDIAVQAGSVFRDVIVDPFVTELERSRFVLDFCYRSLSFSSLLQIDDPLGAGISISVAQSSYKRALGQALFLNDNSEIQALVDQGFDRLAGNFGVTRRIGTYARGEAVFYTSTRPTFTLTVPVSTVISGGGQQFKTTRTVSIPVDGAASFYNPTTRRYSITAPIVSLNIGASGNITSGQIVSGAPTGLRVTNESPTYGGTDAENNNDLTARALGALSSVDTGTKAGYERISRSSPGVIDSFVVGAGDPLMFRDNSIGGKVDIWLRGSSVATVTDVYAPTYGNTYGARFTPIEGEGTYRFQVDDQDAFIYDMIDREDLGLGLKNVTTGEFFNLSGAVIDETGRVLTLDGSIDQPSYAFTDIILGDWRSDVSDKIVLRRQPVTNVLSIKNQSGVNVPNFSFISDEDPMFNGRSAYAQDHVIIPSLGRGSILSAEGESHVLVGTYKDQLNNLGADVLSIVVTDADGSVIYKNPFSNTVPDYQIEQGVNGEVFIVRSEDTQISDGETVLISYNYVENIVITYTTNLVVNDVQKTVDKQKHLTADVLVKETIGAPVNIKGVVVLKRGASPSDVDSLIKGSLSNLLNISDLGGEVHSSDVIREIDAVEGVSYVNVPLTELALRQGTFILREDMTSNSPGAFRRLDQLSNDSRIVWVSSSNIKNTATDGGGDGALVLIDGREVNTLSVSSRISLGAWRETVGTIVGSEGLIVSIGGTPTLIENTENRVVFSLPIGVDPSTVSVMINYRTGDATGRVEDLYLNPLAYFTVGDFSFTYEEER